MADQQKASAALNDAFAAAPAHIKDIIMSGRLERFLESERSKYNLHIDVVGKLSNELVLMLLGLSDPKEFIAELTTLDIPDETLGKIVDDVNNEVFVPLRDQMRSADRTTVPAGESRSAMQAPQPKVASAPVRPSVPIYSPLPAPPTPPAPPAYVTQAIERPAPKQVPPPSVLPGQVPEAVQPRPTPPPAPRIEVPKAVTPPPPVPAEKPVAVPRPDQNARIIHTMARDMQAMKSGTDPMRVAHPAPPAWATAPNPQPMQPPAPPAAPPPPVPPPQPLPQHDAPRTQEPSAPKVPQAITHHLKQYGVDPYREPVE